jgi:Fur family transcriptional regulator, ferric uptake regulator
MKVSRIPPQKLLQNFCNNAPPQRSSGVSLSRVPAAGADPILQASRSARLEEEFLRRGIRLTAQRCAVLGVIEAFPQCRNAGTIHRRARRIDPRIHRVTVYRTIGLLRRHGMLEENGGDWVCPRRGPCPNSAQCDRIHIRCLRCGKVIPFGSGLFDDLTRCVEKDCQFRIARAQMEIDGYCQSCRT